MIRTSENETLIINFNIVWKETDFLFEVDSLLSR